MYARSKVTLCRTSWQEWETLNLNQSENGTKDLKSNEWWNLRVLKAELAVRESTELICIAYFWKFSIGSVMVLNVTGIVIYIHHILDFVIFYCVLWFILLLNGFVQADFDILTILTRKESIIWIKSQILNFSIMKLTTPLVKKVVNSK